MSYNFNKKQKKDKIFILGSTGFIGSALVKRLIELNFKNLYCLYKNEDKKNHLFYDIDTSSINFLKGDISNLEILKIGIKDSSIVINASGKATDWGQKSDFWKVNVLAPKKIVEIIKELNSSIQYIHLSSASVFGFKNYIKNESSSLIKSDCLYTASKVEIHSWLRKQKDNVLITILSPSIVWGPGDQIYIPEIIKRLRKKLLVNIKNNMKINFIYIDDLIEAILLCFYNTNSYNQEFIIDGPEPFMWKDYIQKIAEYSNLPTPKLQIPFSVIFSLSILIECFAILTRWFCNFRPPLTRLQVLLLSKPLRLDISKAKNILNYYPKIDFKNGIRCLKQYVNNCC